MGAVAQCTQTNIYVWMNIARVSFYLSLKFHVTVSGADVTVLAPSTYLRSSRLAERCACVSVSCCHVMWRVPRGMGMKIPCQ